MLFLRLSYSWSIKGKFRASAQAYTQQSNFWNAGNQTRSSKFADQCAVLNREPSAPGGSTGPGLKLDHFGQSRKIPDEP